MIFKRQSGVKCSPRFFLRFDFVNWNIIKKYYKMNWCCGFSAKDDSLILSRWVRVKAHFPLENELIYFIYFFIQIIVSCRIRYVNGRKQDGLSANNLGLHWWLSDKLLMHIRLNVSLIKRLIVHLLQLIQDELEPIRKMICFIFLRISDDLTTFLMSLCIEVPWRSSSYQTLSNAFEMSRSTHSTP